MKALVLDAQALALLDAPPSASKRRLVALFGEALRRNLDLHVPASVFAQAYFDGKRQAELMRFLARPYVKRHALDLAVARVIGAERRRTKHLDVVDQHVAAIARTFDAAIVTSDADHVERPGVRTTIRV